MRPSYLIILNWLYYLYHLSLILIDYRSLSLIIIDYHRFLLIIVDCHCLSENLKRLITYNLKLRDAIASKKHFGIV